MRRSEQVATWIGLVVFIIGAFASFIVHLPRQEERIREIPMSFPGKSIEAVFVEVDIETFQGLPLQESYYQITSSAEGVDIFAVGIQEETVYFAEKRDYSWFDAYKAADFSFNGEKILVITIPDVLLYWILTFFTLALNLFLSALIALIFYGMVRAIEETRRPAPQE